MDLWKRTTKGISPLTLDGDHGDRADHPSVVNHTSEASLSI